MKENNNRSFKKILTALTSFFCSLDDIDEITGNIPFSSEVLDDMRENVGKYPAETGGMIASKNSEDYIDICHFDKHSCNTSGTFYYDVESMSEVYRGWLEKGYTTNGIYHSHPKGYIRPSYHDISTALLHIRFFGLTYFYLPILQPVRNGEFTLYFYVVRLKQDKISVELECVVQAEKEGYISCPYEAWNKTYSVAELDEYRDSIGDNIKKEDISDNSNTGDTAKISTEYFLKVETLYPDKVLDKVIICVGTGGARSFLENMARSGFRNFILIDNDTVSATNIATQGVFVSEIGKKKVEVIRNRILDINPTANVLCVERFLDDSMSDEEFKGYMDMFKGRSGTDYLILGCTDNFFAQKRSAYLALKYGTPYLAAMMYQNGTAAELVFTYPGVTESCPRCLLKSRFEQYENGYQNDVGSAGCPIWATERMNATKGYIALMLLMYHDAPESPYNTMLDGVRNRNFVWIRLTPNLKDTNLGIILFDQVFESASRFTYMDETLWIPQTPDSAENGSEPCKLCNGEGDLRLFKERWANKDTRCIDN